MPIAFDGMVFIEVNKSSSLQIDPDIEMTADITWKKSTDFS